jgi:hypothetical protein
MRSADVATLIRTFMVFLVVYMLLLKINPWVTIFVILIMYLLDGFDGYLAIRSASKGAISFSSYLKAALSKMKKKRRKWRISSR